MKTTVYSQKGEKTGTLEMPSAVFDAAWNPALVWQVAESERANKRKGTAHAKGRAEVRGGGVKPWRQKGTGRARHGSIRSPIWIGGGVTHGPTKEKSYVKKINKKMKKKALFAVLSQKLRDNEMLVLDTLALEHEKTKEAALILRTLAGIKGFEALANGAKTLLLTPASETSIHRAFRNIEGIHVMETRNINVLNSLASRYIIITKEAISKLPVTSNT